MAVALTFDFDAESLWIGRDPASAKRPGTLSQGLYGAKVGLPALLELLARRKRRATFFVPGVVAERHPESVRAIVRAGHELAHHGWEHVPPDAGDAEAERRSLRLGIEALQKISGERPIGFRSPSWDLTPRSIELLGEEGFLYSSNLMDDVHPYVHAGGAIVELPVHWSLADTPFFFYGPGANTRPIQPPSVALEVWRAEFEGIHRWGGCCVFSAHPQVIGRPSRLEALDGLLDAMERRGAVWFATAREIAEHARSQLRAS